MPSHHRTLVRVVIFQKTTHSRVNFESWEHTQQLTNLDPRGVRGENTKGELVEILVFKRSTRFYSFSAASDDFRNKEQINEIEICIAVRIWYE